MKLEESWDAIKAKSANKWKKEVYAAAEVKNKEMMTEECYKKERGNSVIKTKTKTLIPAIEGEGYVRQPQSFMTKHSKLTARAYIMGRYGMLQCAANFSHGYGGKNCTTCGVEDNESHRMNHCSEWSDINLANSEDCIDYELIYSENDDESITVVHKIFTMWDLGNNKNCMRSSDPNCI